VGAHSIGAAKWTGTTEDLIPGWAGDFFQRGDERILVVRSVSPPAKLLDPKWRRASRVTLSLEPLRAGQPVTATDLLGRSRDLGIHEGYADLDLQEDTLIINGARRLQIASAPVASAAPTTVIEAEAGRWSPGWTVTSHPGFSDNKLLEIWSDVDPGSDGYWAE